VLLLLIGVLLLFAPYGLWPLGLQEEDCSPGERPAPARADFYTNPEVPSVQQLMSTAPKKAGTGSADEAAEWLKGVLQERPGEC
jgi:hypothetical protein